MRNNQTYNQLDSKQNNAQQVRSTAQPPQYDQFDLNADRYAYDENAGSRDFLTGAIFGAVIGAAAALLFAPKAGTDFRTDLSSQAGTLKERAKSSQLTSTVAEKSSAVLEKVKNIRSEDGSIDEEKAGEAKDEAKSAVDAVADAVKDKVDTSADTAKTKLDEAEKAAKEAEKSVNSKKDDSAGSSAAMQGRTDPADQGVNESKSPGQQPINSSNNTNNSNSNNKPKNNQPNHNNNNNNNKKNK